MLNYLVENFFKDINKLPKTQEEKYKLMFEETCKRTAKLAALWQLYGFCHGVLNTDNMSILGLTIDYGPFGFMEHFNPKHICNHSDNEGRYRYEAQPDICLWNLIKLAEALDPIVSLKHSKSFAEKVYWEVYNQEYNTKLNKKLGLIDSDVLSDDIKSKFWEIMNKYGGDFTNTFRDLSSLTKEIEL